MTRGQIAIIAKSYTNEKEVLTSCEFNGDMYMPTKNWHGYGRTVTNLLKKVNDMASYHCAVARFNMQHHHYNQERIVYTESIDFLDFTTDYFEKWFSDYVYLKNITEDDVELIVRDKKDKAQKVILKPNQIARLCFGRLERITE